ncbi:MAG: hypothetical protein ACK4M1_08740 [Flavobacterium sp.]
MELYFVGLILMLLCNWYSKTTLQKALVLLDDNKKAMLMTLFQNENKYKGLFAILFLVLYIFAIQFTLIPTHFLMILLFIVFVTLIGFTYIKKVKKLRENNFPIDYIKQFNAATIIQILGILSLVVSSIFIFKN